MFTVKELTIILDGLRLSRKTLAVDIDMDLEDKISRMGDISEIIHKIEKISFCEKSSEE